VVVTASIWMIRRLDLGTLGKAMGSAAWRPLVAAALLNFVHLGFRTLTFASLLGPVRPVPVARLYRYNLSAVAVSILLPIRGGDLFRVWLLNTREQVPRTTAIAVTLLEKAVDLVGLVAVAVPVPLLLPGLPRWVGVATWVVASALVLALATAVLLARVRPRIDDGLLSRFAQGLQAVNRVGPLLLACAGALASWLTDAVEVWLVLVAVGLHLPLGTPLLVLLTLNLAIAVPSTPAQVGAFELGAVVALRLLGVPDERALAFALLYHAVQLVPMSLAGADAVRLAWRIGPAPEEPR
jgi:uncharacterized membrane protein YbhN (UPF0104 family)